VTRQLTRRSVLAAGGASALAALAGCSSVPVLGDGNGDDELPDYDVASLAATIRDSRVDTTEAYPGSVPASLVDAHRERTTDLVDSVPESPSFPNSAVQAKVRNKRESAVSRLPAEGAVEAPVTLDDVDTWEHARDDAAAAAYAYRAASGDFDAEDAAAWRRRVETDYRTERRERPYRGETPAEALAVTAELESRLDTARRWLSPDRAFPERPASSLDAVDDLASNLERADAAVATVRGLREARPDGGLPDHWNAIAETAGELGEVYEETVDELALRDVVAGDSWRREAFDRDVGESTAAHHLFHVAAPSPERERGDTAVERSNYAVAVLEYADALLGALVLSQAVDDVRSGDHGTPPNVDVVQSTRAAAIDAVDAVAAEQSGPLGALLAADLRRQIDYRDRNLLQDLASDRHVVRAAGGYAYVTYAADQLPAVVDRVIAELGRASE